MWGEGWDDRAHLLDDLLIEADLMSELQETSFWEGWREDKDIELRPDEYDWSEAA